MIFLTVGTMDMPFERLVRFIDEAKQKGIIKDDIYGQIGECKYKPKAFAYSEYMEKTDFDEKFKEADIIISHAGMGCIISALDELKPILVCAREAQYGEHVNDHQVETAKKFEDKGLVYSINTDEIDTLGLQLTEMYNSKSRTESNYSGAYKIAQAIISKFPDILNKKTVATASSGGHIIQLEKILNSGELSDNINTYVSTLDLMKTHFEDKGKQYFILGECNRQSGVTIFIVFIRAFFMALRLRPKYVISTGALPSAFFCFWSKVFGSKIVWVDSIANIDKISMSGNFVLKFGDILFTQWEELQTQNYHFSGSVL